MIYYSLLLVYPLNNLNVVAVYVFLLKYCIRLTY